MQIVIADTGPVRYLAEIDLLDLLPRLFETVFIPSVVYEEVLHPSAPGTVRAPLQGPPSWLKVMPPVPTTDPALLRLGDGERAAIALALSLQADLLLIDERMGVTVAQRKGLEITGTLGILIMAAEQGFANLADAFSRLRRTNFHYSENLLQKLLAEHTKESETP